MVEVLHRSADHIRNKQLKLDILHFGRYAGSIILINLIRQEVHIIALQELLVQTAIEISSIQRHRNTLHDMVGNHTVKEQVCLTLSNHFNAIIFYNDNGYIGEVLTNKSPCCF